MKKKVIFLFAQPIQYFAPFLKRIASSDELEIMVYYCSDYGVKKSIHEPTKNEVKWDIPLLEGYNYTFLKNYSWSPSIFHFFGLMNFGIIKKLFQERKCILVIHGWNSFTYVLTIIFGKLLGHTICIRAETPLSQEIKKKFELKFLKKALFRFIDKFLYIGSQNKAYFQSFGIKESNLIYTPYSVDNHRFQKAAKELKTEELKLKDQLNIPREKTIFLFCANLIEKKRPMDLLKAFDLLNREDAHLVFVGDGPLRKEMEAYILQNKISNLTMAGFINQSKIVEYYAIADAFVICSGVGETWGLVVNEAMNFSLPILSSSMVGCSDDLVQSKNGFKFECGDIKLLSQHLESILKMPDSQKKEMGENSLEIVSHYSYEVSIKNMENNLI